MLPLETDQLWRRMSIPYPTNIAATYLLISRSQYQVFRVAHFVGPLSIMGSLAIIFRIARIDRHEPDASGRRTYHRLLVAMSICDVFGSLAFSFGTSAVPKETLLETARGNTATCTAQGFFIQWFAVAVLYYNTGMMIYFVMTIRYGWNESRSAKWLEPFIHVWALVVPFAQAVVGLFLEVFNPIGFGNFCYIAPSPPLCGLFDACTRGLHAKILYTLFCTVPESVLLAVIYVSILLIYCTVRSQSRRALAISANQEAVRAKMKTVVVQSWLFAIIFFITWVFAVLGPIMGIAIKQADKVLRAEYILTVLTCTFLPLQGFFNFCIYIRPRFVRLREAHQLSIGRTLTLAVFGGRETNTSRRRSSILHHRKRSSMSAETQSRTFGSQQGNTVANSGLQHQCPNDNSGDFAPRNDGLITESDNRSTIEKMEGGSEQGDAGLSAPQPTE